MQKIVFILALLFLAQSIPAYADITTGLLLYWKLNESSGTNAPDASGNNNFGTTFNNPAWASGKFGNAIYVNGSTQCVSAPSSLGLTGDAEFTYAFWVNFSSVASHGVIGWGSSAVALQAAGGWIGGNGAGIFAASFAGANNAWGSTVLTTGQWYHIVVTKTPGAINATTKIYINGVAETLNASSSTGTPNISNINLQVGRWADYADYTNAKFDEVHIYNRALSASDVLELYKYHQNTIRGAIIRGATIN